LLFSILTKLYYTLQAVEHPLAVQLGGSEAEKLGPAAALCEQYGGFSEINLNVGCPSRKVSGKCFGASLMLEPERVREITYAMGRQATRTPITVKCRLGVDSHDSYEELVHFLMTVRSAGVDHFIVHARKALLGGVSTAGNRSIPPLRYDWVHRLRREYPDLTIVLNGGELDTYIELPITTEFLE
jgi:tRNA-dihydrouridine synthase A